ncbi:MAG: hypothetical protein D3904_12360, partial [Candidatus Electrothrix sp. EH2]|nr:hypothetical protein [Candidatus Electrothrix sp. EH2]
MLLLSPGAFAADSNVLLQFIKTEYTPVHPLLPTSLPLADSFKPGNQPFAGTITSFYGTAYVYHENVTIVYKIKENFPVFNGDTLITGEQSRIVIQMSDESILTLTSQTKLTIDRSLPRMKVRDTVLQLFLGKVRALVKKLAGEYTIRTPTGSIGVRGTDFAIAVAPVPLPSSSRPGWKKKTTAGMLTTVLTGKSPSIVELAGQLGPSVTIGPLSASGVRTGGKAEEPVYVGPAALTLLEKIAARPEPPSLAP